MVFFFLSKLLEETEAGGLLGPSGPLCARPSTPVSWVGPHPQPAGTRSSVTQHLSSKTPLPDSKWPFRNSPPPHHTADMHRKDDTPGLISKN